MTGEQLKTDYFEKLVDDTLDATTLYRLFSTAKNKIERRYKLKILEAVDSSKSRSTGDTYLSTKTLPSDWRETLAMYVDTLRYYPISFIQRIQYRNAARRFYIDQKNNVFALTGAGGAGTINHYYLVKTTDFTVANKDTDNIITWPEEFQPLVAYEAAKIFQANIDPDSVNLKLSAAQQAEYDDLLNALIDWDADLKVADMGGRHGFETDPDSLFKLGDL